MQSHVKYTISILSERLYILNQLRRQEFNISGLTQVFMALVVARFQYVLPALAGQLSSDDLRKADAVFSKARRWQLTLHTSNSADLIKQCDKHLFRAALNPTHCLHSMLPQRIICMDANLGRKVMDMSCHWQKLNCIKIVFNTLYIQICLIWIDNLFKRKRKRELIQIIDYYYCHATTISYIYLSLFLLYFLCLFIPNTTFM